MVGAPTGGGFAAPVAAKIVAGFARARPEQRRRSMSRWFAPQQILPLERLEPQPPEPDYSAGRSPRCVFGFNNAIENPKSDQRDEVA